MADAFILREDFLLPFRLLKSTIPLDTRWLPANPVVVTPNPPVKDRLLHYERSSEWTIFSSVNL